MEKKRIFSLVLFVVGNGFAGDIALDDIVFDTSFCSVLDECDFEQGWFYWQNRSQNDFNWQRGRNGSTSSRTPTIGQSFFTLNILK
jgi:hypothetical protein